MAGWNFEQGQAHNVGHRMLARSPLIYDKPTVTPRPFVRLRRRQRRALALRPLQVEPKDDPYLTRNLQHQRYSVSMLGSSATVHETRQHARGRGMALAVEQHQWAIFNRPPKARQKALSIKRHRARAL